MPDKPPVSELASRWHELQRQGKAVSLAALCADCPERLPELQAHLRAVANMESFLEVDRQPTGPEIKAPEESADALAAQPSPRSTPSQPIPTAAAFLKTLRQLPLLQPGQFEELTEQAQGQHPDARLLARMLLERGWLTPFQVNQLLRGRGQELVLGQYVLVERLGEGGMGQVFKAHHRSLDRIVALKLIRAERVADADAVQRFRREVRLAAQLQHANVVLVFDADQANGVHFMAMEYVPGTDFSKLVKEQGPLPIAAACDYIRQAALGLQHAHEKGLVHRDIKPSNLLLAPGGLVKILDFGLARLTSVGQQASELTHSGAIMGTPDFIAPEQARDSRDVDIRADLYSLGCTFYLLLTGQPPFQASTLTAKLLQHQMDDPVPVEQVRPEVPLGVAAIVRKLMAKKPEDRYQTPAEVATALAALRGSPAKKHRVSSDERSDRNADLANTVDHRPTKRWPLLAGAVVLGALLLATVALWWQMSHGGKSDARGKSSASGAVAGSTPDPLPAKYKNNLNMEFVLVPRGKFLMGGGGGKPGDTEVAIAHDFYLGKYEVTQDEWQKVTGINPSFFARSGGGKNAVANVTDAELKRFPVESVSWNDAQEFIKLLNAKEPEPGWEYRLPTEAEWEYACRGGLSSNKFDYGFDFYLDRATNTLLPAQANFRDSGYKRTCKVGSYAPNRLGLYNMHDNVREWCQDEIPSDPKDPKATSQRAHRGGGWINSSAGCTATHRYSCAPLTRHDHLGLRVARVPITVPAPANAPFNAQQARAHQQAWATHLGTTVEITNFVSGSLTQQESQHDQQRGDQDPAA